MWKNRETSHTLKPHWFPNMWSNNKMGSREMRGNLAPSSLSSFHKFRERNLLHPYCLYISVATNHEWWSNYCLLRNGMFGIRGPQLISCRLSPGGISGTSGAFGGDPIWNLFHQKFLPWLNSLACYLALYLMQGYNANLNWSAYETQMHWGLSPTKKNSRIFP